MFTNQNFLLNQESTIPINIKKPLISIMIHERWKISKNWSHLTPGKMSFDNIMIFTEINETSNIFDICTTGPIPYCTSWNNWYPQRTLGRGQIIPENFPSPITNPPPPEHQFSRQNWLMFHSCWSYVRIHSSLWWDYFYRLQMSS